MTPSHCSGVVNKRLRVAACALLLLAGSSTLFIFREKPEKTAVVPTTAKRPEIPVEVEKEQVALPAGVATIGLDQHEFYEEQSLAITRAVKNLRKPGAREALVTQLEALEALHENQVAARAAELGLPLTRSSEDGEIAALIGFEGDRPLYIAAQNADAAVATGASFVRQNAGFDPVWGPGIDGAGFGAGVFELGVVYAHEEFALPGGGSRVVPLTTAAATGHGSHVGGTIAAAGLDPEAKGMAPAATLYSWYQESAAKYASRAIAWPGEPDQMIVTNTSLGDSGSGRYAAGDQTRDDWARLFPYTIMFQCAGNAGSAYETLNGISKEAKNHFTVGSVVDLSRNAAGAITSGGGIVASSSRGPTDDGRIKPEIVANGNSLYSIGSTAGSYGRRSGTSMSTPNATGSAILLQDYFSKRFPGHLMRSDTLKGLIIHTADDAGRTGPDYIYGYGILNVHAAAKIIKTYADQPAGRQISHSILKQGETHSRTLAYSGSGPLRVTIAWLDPVGPASRYDDDRMPALVNDLNVTVTSPSGVVHYPWVMPYVTNGFDPADRGAPAVKGVNTVDNAELVVIEAPGEAGVYTISVSHAGSLQDGEQSYSLIHSGFSTPASAPAPVLSGWSDLGDGWFEFTGADFMLGARVALTVGETEIASGAGMQVAASRIVCRFSAPPAEGASFVVINPDGQASSAEFSLPTGAGIVLTANEATWTYRQNFDSLTRNISADEPWVNDPAADGVAGLKGWHAGYFQANDTVSASTVVIRGDSGTSSTGRLHSYGTNSSASDRALGSIRQDTLMEIGGSVRMGLRLVNRTGRRLTGFSLTFYGEQWRRSSSSATQYIDAAYAIFPEDSGTLHDTGANYQPLARFNTLKGGSYTGNLNGNASDNRTLMTAEIDGLAWEPEQELWIRWVTPNFTGIDAGLAIDDVEFVARRTLEPTAYETYALAHGLNGADAEPWSVLTGDGLPNVLKFALGVAPFSSDTGALTPVTRIKTEGGDTFFTLTFSLGNPMNWDLESRALRGAGVVLWLEQSADLALWSPAILQPSETAYQEELALLPAGTAIEFRQDAFLDAGVSKLFFRLRVELE